MDYCIRNLSDPDVLPPGKNLTALSDLWASPDPYVYDDELFVKAVKQCLSRHVEKNDFYRDWMARNKFSVDDLNSIDDIAKIPFLHANFYKTHTIKTARDEDIAITLTSSGTTGQKSQMFFDNWTIFASDKSADMEAGRLGMITDEPTNFLLYSYEPAEGVNVGTLRTRQMMRRYAKENELVYALKYTGSGHEFDLFGCIDALLRFERKGLPVRLLGFPAFLYFTLEKMKDMGYPPLKLNPKSLVMMGGGWKGFVDKQLSPQEFRAYIKERLGLDESRCHESYGAVEHGVAYMDCDNHHFHVPTYSRVLIRDVRTLEVLPYGKPGFLNVISPINTGVPVVSLLLGDLAMLHEGKSCGCGVDAPWFEILGRAGTTKNRSCAIAAAELLRK